MVHSKMSFQPGTKPILTIVNDIKNITRWGLDLQPSYQRWYIWKRDYQYKLIYSLFNSYPIWSIILRNRNESNDKGAKMEVVDWQQRLTTIYNFINDEIILDSETSKKIIEISLDYFEDVRGDKKIDKILSKYEKWQNIKLKYSDLPDSLKWNISAVNIATISISNSTEEQVSEYFRFVQNQERLRAWEIIDSIPDTILEKYLKKLENKDNLLKILWFNDNRKEFEKLFYWIIWLFDKWISLWCTDNQIKEYVSKKEDDLEWESLLLVNNMVENLNKLSNIDLEFRIKSNKRLLKFVMLLSWFEFIDFSSVEEIKKNLEKMYEINNKLSAFNSAKKDVLEKTFGSVEEAEKYRPMSLIVKWAHNFDRVKEVMSSLWHIILN